VTRPARLVAVAGTATDVGKTWVTVRLLKAASLRGFRVAARKPVQSFIPGDGPTDAELLADAAGEEPTMVCAPEHWLPMPMAPPMAAAALGRDAPKLAVLVDSCQWPTGIDLGLVETVGGLRSPVADEGDSLALTRALAPDEIILVAQAGLGTINDCRLAADAMAPVLPRIVLNHYEPLDDLHQRNRRWLEDRCRLPTYPVDPANPWEDQLLDVILGLDRLAMD